MIPANLPDLSLIDTPDQVPQANEEVYDFRQLLDAVIEATDLIVTIPSDQVDFLKEGLTVRKAKDNQKLKNSGLRVGNEVLKFTVYPAVDENKKEIPGQSCVRIKLGARKSISILKIELPDDRI